MSEWRPFEPSREAVAEARLHIDDDVTDDEIRELQTMLLARCDRGVDTREQRLVLSATYTALEKWRYSSGLEFERHVEVKRAARARCVEFLKTWITADSITDEQIRELRTQVLLRGERRDDSATIELCDVALGTRCTVDVDAYRSARARCAQILNAQRSS